MLSEACLIRREESKRSEGASHALGKSKSKGPEIGRRRAHFRDGKEAKAAGTQRKGER